MIAMLENDLACTRDKNHFLTLESARLERQLINLKETVNDFSLSLSMAGKEIDRLGGEGKYYRQKGFNYIENITDKPNE